MSVNVKLDLNSLDSVLKEKGVLPGGRVQMMLTNEIYKMSDPYVPFDNGPLKNLVTIAPDGTYYQHDVPYGRYHWFGKVMVDPESKKGAMFNQDYGFWSRPGVQKVLTNRDMKYQGAPQRGPMWTIRAWAQHGEKLISNIERMINK